MRVSSPTDQHRCRAASDSNCLALNFTSYVICINSRKSQKRRSAAPTHFTTTMKPGLVGIVPNNTSRASGIKKHHVLSAKNRQKNKNLYFNEKRGKKTKIRLEKIPLTPESATSASSKDTLPHKKVLKVCLETNWTKPSTLPRRSRSRTHIVRGRALPILSRWKWKQSTAAYKSLNCCQVPHGCKCLYREYLFAA